MPNSRRNVLAVGLSAEEFQRFVPFLSRQSFEVDRFPSALGAVELVTRIAFELLLVRFPLPDMDLAPFLERVREDRSPCKRSSLLVLHPTERSDEAGAFVGRGANRTIGLEASEGEIQENISSVLNVAPRKAARFMARFQITLGDKNDMLLCQTENISTTGLLIRTDRRYEKGTQIDFEFSFGKEPRPLRGVAEVVRHTTIGKEQVAGIGMRFLAFEGDSQRRLEAFLQSV
ncbi:MAG: PilZ domain-containing protein [Thermoanaerobaculia bacterium]|nr:PilZ domain-containing protein [Thermoanaerobaculia bacterium]